jgi:hypothetical protein
MEGPVDLNRKSDFTIRARYLDIDAGGRRMILPNLDVEQGPRRQQTFDVWDVRTRRKIATLQREGLHAEDPLAALSGDGRFALTTGVDATTNRPRLCLWDVDRSEQVDAIDVEGTGGFTFGGRSRDGSLLFAFTSRDGVVIDLKAGVIRYDFKAPEGEDIQSAAFLEADDARRELLVQFRNGIGRIYPVDVVETARRLRSRRLTMAERKGHGLWTAQDDDMLREVETLLAESLFVDDVIETLRARKMDDDRRSDMIQFTVEHGGVDLRQFEKDLWAELLGEPPKADRLAVIRRHVDRILPIRGDDSSWIGIDGILRYRQGQAEQGVTRLEEAWQAYAKRVDARKGLHELDNIDFFNGFGPSPIIAARVAIAGRTQGGEAAAKLRTKLLQVIPEGYRLMVDRSARHGVETYLKKFK